MEYLSRMLKGLDEHPDFAYHPKCKGLKLKHQYFVDDLMAFGKADKTSPLLIKDRLETFGRMSGLVTSPPKSHIYIAGTDRNVEQFILESIQFNEGKLCKGFLWHGSDDTKHSALITTQGPRHNL